MKYNIDYMIAKYEAIPDEKIITGIFNDGNGGHCVDGHAGLNHVTDITPEGIALREIFEHLPITDKYTGLPITNVNYSTYPLKAAKINDGYAAEYQQPTAKQRIMAALYDAKKLKQAMAQLLNSYEKHLDEMLEIY